MTSTDQQTLPALTEEATLREPAAPHPPVAATPMEDDNMSGLTVLTKPYKDLVYEAAGFTNPRKIIDKKKDTELAEAIAHDGLLYALCVWVTKDDKGKDLYIVVEGGRRWRAIGILAKSGRASSLVAAVPIRPIKAKTLLDAKRIALIGNVQREDLTTYEVTAGMAELRDGGMQQKDIAPELHKSKTWVSRKLAAWDNGAPEVLVAWREGKLPDEDIEALASIMKTDPATGKPVKPKVPDHAEQKKRLEKLLALREKAARDGNRNGVRAAKNAARGKQKGEKPKPDSIRRYAKLAEASKDPYLRGLHDMALFSLGELSAGQFDPKWTKFAQAQGLYKTDKKQGPAQARASKRKASGSTAPKATRTAVTKRKAPAKKKAASSRRK